MAAQTAYSDASIGFLFAFFWPVDLVFDSPSGSFMADALLFAFQSFWPVDLALVHGRSFLSVGPVSGFLSFDSPSGSFFAERLSAFFSTIFSLI